MSHDMTAYHKQVINIISLFGLRWRGLLSIAVGIGLLLIRVLLLLLLLFLHLPGIRVLPVIGNLGIERRLAIVLPYSLANSSQT